VAGQVGDGIKETFEYIRDQLNAANPTAP